MCVVLVWACVYVYVCTVYVYVCEYVWGGAHTHAPTQWEGPAIYLDKAHRVLHDVLSPKKVESLVLHSDCRVEHADWHAGHPLPAVADTVVSLHGAQDLLPFSNAPDGEDEVLMGSAPVGVAGR